MKRITPIPTTRLVILSQDTTMKTNVVTLRPPINDGREPRAVGANARCLAMKPIEDPDAPTRHFWLDLFTSIWCGAIVGCIGAAVIPPFPEDRS
jgi:hypothetical protein